MTDYRSLNSALAGLIDGVPHKIANLANASALLWQMLEDINWAGFYLMEEGKLVLGPFQGKPACIEIPLGKGVCGTAAAEKKTQPCLRLGCLNAMVSAPRSVNSSNRCDLKNVSVSAMVSLLLSYARFWVK